VRNLKSLTHISLSLCKLILSTLIRKSEASQQNHPEKRIEQRTLKKRSVKEHHAKLKTKTRSEAEPQEQWRSDLELSRSLQARRNSCILLYQLVLSHVASPVSRKSFLDLHYTLYLLLNLILNPALDHPHLLNRPFPTDLFTRLCSDVSVARTATFLCFASSRHTCPIMS